MAYTPRTRGFRPRLRVKGVPMSALYPANLVPQRGEPVPPESVVRRVIETGGSHYLKRVAGFDLWGLNDLAFIAQPVWWYGRLAKVVLVGVRAADSRLLDTQSEGLSPMVIESSYQIV